MNALSKWHEVMESVERDRESGSDTDDTLSTASRSNHSCSTGGGGGGGGSGGDGEAGSKRDERRGKEGSFADGVRERVGELWGEGEGTGSDEREGERRRGREEMLDRLVGQLEAMRECCALALMLGRQVVLVCVCARACVMCMHTCMRGACLLRQTARICCASTVTLADRSSASSCFYSVPCSSLLHSPLPLLQREQQLTLARDRAHSSLGFMRKAIDSEMTGIGCLEDRVASIESSLHIFGDAWRRTGQMVAMENELRRTLEEKNEEILMLQLHMASSLMWASQ